MVQRRRFPAPNDYTISVATERMKDGRWSAHDGPGYQVAFVESGNGTVDEGVHLLIGVLGLLNDVVLSDLARCDLVLVAHVLRTPSTLRGPLCHVLAAYSVRIVAYSAESSV